MKKYISIFLSVLIVTLSFSACSSQKQDSHKHSVLPGSDLCETCGEEISFCTSCQMVNDADAEKCWFCSKSF